MAPRLKRDAEPLSRQYECPTCKKLSYFHERADDLPESSPEFTLICVNKWGGLVDPKCPQPEWKPRGV